MHEDSLATYEFSGALMSLLNTDYDLTVIATTYNDAANIAPLIKEIESHLALLGISYEIILIDDASKDNSENVIRELCSLNKNIKGISLSRNCGQQIAISSGMQHASGKYVLLMDGDLQNPPSAIPDLFRKISSGYDIVYTVSKVRNNKWDELSSKFFWFLMNKVLRVGMVPNQLMMRIMTADFVEKYNSYSETNRAVAGITHDVGMNFGILEIENRKRVSGSSNYNYFKRFNLMVDFIIGLSVTPLNAMIHFGLIVFLLTSIFSAYELYVFFVQGSIPGFTSIILSIFFFNSMIIVLLGVIGKYLANIYIEVRNRPLFFIRKTFNI
jgi:dolichol-phosphate mannosyltransferase